MYEIKYREKDDFYDSGIKWLRILPKTWNIKAVKYGFVRKNRKAKLQNPIVLSLARRGIKIREIESNDGQIAESYYNYNPVTKGDLLLNPMDLVSGANCNMSNVEGVISPAYFNLRSKPSHSPKFYDYYFKLQYWSRAFFAHGKGVSYENRWTLNNETLMNYKIPYTEYIEQQKIANFLDIKTAQFDQIISKKEQLIEKLEEAKKSLISEVVTGKVKIVDGQLIERDDSEMKDSGVEEFGLIANDYRVSKIKFYGDFKAGISKSAEYFGKGYPFVNYSDVYKNEELVMGSGLAVTSEKERIDFSIKKGDVFFTRTSETIDDIGESSICKTDILKGSFSGFIIRYRVWDKNKIDYNYAKYYFQNLNVKKWFARQLNIVTRASLSQDKLKELPLILPAYEQQKYIGIFLNDKVSKIDLIIKKTIEQIEKLKQAKQSLISEAVTGKIDLRDWKIIEEGEMQ